MSDHQEGTQTISENDILEHPDIITKLVRVNYRRPKHKALEATGRKLRTDQVAVSAAPVRGEGIVEKKIGYIPHSVIPKKYHRLGGYISEDALRNFLDENDLISEDLHTAAALAEDDPEFARDHQYGIQFKNEDEDWFYAGVTCWDSERMLLVNCPLKGAWHTLWGFLVSRISD
jgi:hypothetical protein